MSAFDQQAPLDLSGRAPACAHGWSDWADRLIFQWSEESRRVLQPHRLGKFGRSNRRVDDVAKWIAPHQAGGKMKLSFRGSSMIRPVRKKDARLFIGAQQFNLHGTASGDNFVIRIRDNHTHCREAARQIGLLGLKCELPACARSGKLMRGHRSLRSARPYIQNDSARGARRARPWTSASRALSLRANILCPRTLRRAAPRVQPRGLRDSKHPRSIARTRAGGNVGQRKSEHAMHENSTEEGLCAGRLKAPNCRNRGNHQYCGKDNDPESWRVGGSTGSSHGISVTVIGRYSFAELSGRTGPLGILAT